MIRRRIFALVAVFAVAFGALWPLVSAAKPRDPQIPLFLCTQSGVHVPGAPSDAGDDFHCPLCSASADGVMPYVLASQEPQTFVRAAAEVARYTHPHPLSCAQPPPSRAPPALS